MSDMGSGTQICLDSRQQMVYVRVGAEMRVMEACGARQRQNNTSLLQIVETTQACHGKGSIFGPP